VLKKRNEQRQAVCAEKLGRLNLKKASTEQNPTNCNIKKEDINDETTKTKTPPPLNVNLKSCITEQDEEKNNNNVNNSAVSSASSMRSNTRSPLNSQVQTSNNNNRINNNNNRYNSTNRNRNRKHLIGIIFSRMFSNI
jgi:hypothetical protein